MDRIIRLVAMVALAGMLAGCAMVGKGEPVKDPQAELNARLTSQEMVARYEQMQQRLRERLDTELGPFAWQIRPDGRESTCSAEYSGLDGKQVSLDPWGFPGGIPDADWPRAKQIITETIAEYGFTTPTLQVDEAGRHTTSAADLALGAQFRLITEVNTTMRTTTGCHRGTFG